MIGTGKVQRVTAKSIQSASDTRLLAVVSRDKDRAIAFAKEFGIERAYDSLDEMLRAPDINAVYVASPNALHAAQTITIARAGKHVLCEKPMATTVKDCRDMIDACRRNSVRLGINLQYRQYPVQHKARELVASGALGNITFANAQVELPIRYMPDWYYQPGMAGAGALYAVGVHRIDLLRFILGSEVEMVSAFFGERSRERPFELTVLAMLEFKSGAYANVHFSYEIPYGTQDLQVHGKRASLFGDTNSPWFSGGAESEGKLLLKAEGCTTEYRFKAIDAYRAVIEDFNRSITEGTEPMASGTDGLRAAEIALAILESGEQGKTVKLDG